MPYLCIAFETEVYGRLAQLVQSICLTSRGSAVRIRQRPHEQKSPMRLITKEIIIGYELMRFASARPFLSNGSYLSLFKWVSGFPWLASFLLSV